MEICNEITGTHKLLDQISFNLFGMISFAPNPSDINKRRIHSFLNAYAMC